MSTELYDLAARLRAARTGRVVPRSRYAPAAPMRGAVAVTVTTSPGGRTTLTASTRALPSTDPSASPGESPAASNGPVRTATGHGADTLSALAALGVGASIQTSAAPQGSDAPRASEDGPSEPWRTLVVADAATLRRLHTILAHTPRGSRWEAQAAVLTWWLQRAEHPGSAVVLDVVAACARRWYAGEAPAADRQVATWRRWLGVDPGAPEGTALLDLAALVTAGTTLPGLDENAAADERSWAYHLTRLAGGWDFRRSDTPTEAALGLATRYDAADLYDSLRLDDPLVADRARFDGTIVTGTLTWLHERTAELRADRLTSRLRSGKVVEGTTAGPAPGALPGSAVSTCPTLFRATVTDTRMGSDGTLTIHLEDVSLRRGQPAATSQSARSSAAPALMVGQGVQLRPERVQAKQQQQSRSNRRSRYTGHNWLIRSAAPAPTRRDVPWDVVMAAATD